MPRFTCYDTVFESQIDISSFHPTDAPATVTIRFGSVPDSLTNPTGAGMAWTANATEVLLTVPEVARYHIINGKEIVVDPLSEAGRSETFLVGVPVGACLMQNGATVLHGAAAEVAGGAIVAVGANGAGKSSLIAALVQQGGSRITDNLAVIRFKEQQPSLQPGPSSMRLWQDMAAELGHKTSEGRQVSPEMNKFVFDAPNVATKPTALRAILCINAQQVSEPILHRMQSGPATAAVMGNHFRGKIARLISSAALDRAAAIATTTPVYELTRPTAGWPPKDLADFVLDSMT